MMECKYNYIYSDSFHPRRSDEARRRRRREIEEAAEGGAHEVDQVNMYRSVDVVSAEEGGEKRKDRTVTCVILCSGKSFSMKITLNTKFKF